jgi:aldehyde dehydrogenase (NAD+)
MSDIQFSSEIQAQRDFFLSDTTKNTHFRIAQLKKLRAVLKENETKMAEAIFLDFGKSEFDLYTTELSIIYGDIDESVKKIKSWSKRRRARTNVLNMPAKSFIIPEPLGVSLIIGAWNYPFQLCLSPAIAAISAGCTVVLKPSELPSRTSAVMAEMINSQFDPGFFRVIEGGVPEMTALLNEKYDKIFFTGSIPVGKIVYQAAAKYLTPVTLELGGKSPAFVTASCNMDVTVRRLVWAKFLNAGQTCIAPDYLLIEKSMESVFLQKFIAEIERSKFAVENGNYVQIVNERNFDRVAQHLAGQVIFYGGQMDREKRYIAPTILTNITFDHPIMKDEIFGPILPIISFTSIDDAIQYVKQRPKPLSLYVFSDNRDEQNKILSSISFGGGSVNDAIMHIANQYLPFGGVGDSGMGNYHGIAGFRAFSHEKSILHKGNFFEPSLKYSPHTVSRLNWIKRLMSWI